MRKLSVAMAVCAALLGVGKAVAAPTPQELCNTARIKAWRKYLMCVEKVIAIDGSPGFSNYTMLAKCRHTYFKKWTSLQGKSDLAGSTCAGSRFTDNLDGTVTDNYSGLVWEKKDDAGSIHDKDNTYTWSTGAPFKENGTVFTVFLNIINGGGGFGGSNGWRLPTVHELQTILRDFPCRGAGGGPTCSCPSPPCIDPALDAANTQAFSYWSYTTYVPGAPDDVWDVPFDGGYIGGSGKTNSNYARAVRGGL